MSLHRNRKRKTSIAHPSFLAGAILCNIIWSFNPVMGKVVLDDFGPAHLSLLRHGSALLGFLLIVGLGLAKRRSIQKFFAFPQSNKDHCLFLFLGFFTFCTAPLFVAFGLDSSQATDNAIIIAMEPMITVLIAWVVLREPITQRHGTSLLIALVGFSMLSKTNFSELSANVNAHFLGNLLILASLTGEGAYSTFIRLLLPRFRPTQIFGTGLFLGVTLLCLIVIIHSGPVPFEKLTWRSALAVIWLGPIGTTFTYHYWTTALGKGVAIPALALTLFLQPVLGSLWGVFLLDESFTWIQTLGGLLILAAVAGQSIRLRHRLRECRIKKSL